MLLTSLGLLYSIYEKTYGDAHAKLEKSSNFQIYPWGVNLTPHSKLPEDRVNSSLFNVIGLSFLFIETKELCEARAKLEMSSNFQIYPWGVNLTPHSKLPEHRVNSLLFNVTNDSPIKTVN